MSDDAETLAILDPDVTDHTARSGHRRGGGDNSARVPDARGPSMFR